MGRIFKEHNKREIYSLNGFWNFMEDSTASGEGAGWHKEFPTCCEKMYVPSCYNMAFEKLSYQGLAWYNTKIDIKSDISLLEFEAVLGYCKVWLDGKLLGEHYGGYTAFSFLLNNIGIGEHNLTVLTDNSSSGETLPSNVADWYSYGGISRSVKLHSLGSTLISGLKIDYILSGDYKSADITVKANIDVFDEKVHNVNLWFDGRKLESKQTSGGSIVFTFKAGDITAWDMASPKLYNIMLETEDDDIIERVGFRKIETDGRKILLNGKQIFLKGVNRHEDHPEFGNAFPVALMQKDIDIVKNLNCNTIRGSHYPNSHEFLDLLDEQGILFWSEIPMWGYTEEELKSPILQERALLMHREMVEQYYNHTSIVLWGMFNEIDSKTEIAYDIAEKIFTLLRSMDSSRLITYATDRAEFDICYKFCDVIGINKYFGWYGGGTDAWAQFFATVEDWLQKQGAADKPIIMSEFGGAALYGNHTFDNIKWSEEYQANLLGESIDAFVESGMITGAYIWHFADARTIRPVTDRARGFNNKGILNEYRKPKSSYFAVKEKFSKL